MERQEAERGPIKSFRVEPIAGGQAMILHVMDEICANYTAALLALFLLI